MAIRLDRSVTALAAAMLLAYGTVSDAQRADRAASAQAPARAQAMRDVRVSELIGMDVRNARGENLGDVSDVVIDTENGRVSYVVVGIGGFLGIGEKLSSYPMSAFKVSQAGMRGDMAAAGRAGTTDKSPGNPLDNDGVPGDKGPIGSDRTADATRAGTTDRSPGNPTDNDGVRGDKGPIGSDRAGATERPGVATGTPASRMLPGGGAGDMHLVLDADPERLKRAPNFDRDQWPDWNDAKYRGEIDRAAGTTGASKVGRLLRGSQLVDADIRDGRGGNVGEVEDLVVDVRNGTVRYAVVDFDQAWTPDDKLVTLPMKALRPSGDKGELVFAGERSQIERAPSFEKGKWPDLNAGAFRTDVDRYVSSWSTTRGTAAATPGSGTASAPADRTRGTTAARSGAAGGGTTDTATQPAPAKSPSSTQPSGSGTSR